MFVGNAPTKVPSTPTGPRIVTLADDAAVVRKLLDCIAASLTVSQRFGFSGRRKAVAIGRRKTGVHPSDTMHQSAGNLRVGYENMISDVAFDAKQELFISTSPEQTIVWDMTCRSKTATLPGSTFLAFALRTNLLATAFTWAEKTVVLSRIVAEEN